VRDLQAAIETEARRQREREAAVEAAAAAAAAGDALERGGLEETRAALEGARSRVEAGERALADSRRAHALLRADFNRQRVELGELTAKHAALTARRVPPPRRAGFARGGLQGFQGLRGLRDGGALRLFWAGSCMHAAPSPTPSRQ